MPNFIVIDYKTVQHIQDYTVFTRVSFLALTVVFL